MPSGGKKAEDTEKHSYAKAVVEQGGCEMDMERREAQRGTEREKLENGTGLHSW